jgi:hypothetical protein
MINKACWERWNEIRCRGGDYPADPMSKMDKCIKIFVYDLKDTKVMFVSDLIKMKNYRLH